MSNIYYMSTRKCPGNPLNSGLEWWSSQQSHIAWIMLTFFSSLSTTPTTFLPARCFNEESCLSLKQLEGYLVVLQPDAPQISLSGVGPHLARPAPEFEGPRGVPLFPELRIVCSLSHAVNTAAQGMEGGGESHQFLI